MRKLNVAVVGATGMVGRTFLKVLEERNFPINEFYVMASARSSGAELTFRGKTYVVEELKETSFDGRGIDVALFSAGGGTSGHFAPFAAKAGCVVVDNSSFWRQHDDVPLVVPEVNPEDVKLNSGIIANPNCSTIPAVVALKPLHEAFKIKRVIYSTYQSVSGAGMGGIKDLEDGTYGKSSNTTFRYEIAGNIIPQIDVFTESGYTKEELKMVFETKKILHAPDIKVTATTVRVPVKFGHCVSINVEFENPFEMNEVLELLKNTKGLVLQNDTSKFEYPMPLTAEGKDEVFAGRIRRDDTVDNGLNLWVVADNVRKGAATNAVQIAELLV